MLRPITLALFFLATTLSPAQQWVELMQDPSVPFSQVRASFDAWAGSHPVERSKGRKVFERWAWFMEQRVGSSGLRPDLSAYATSWKKVRNMQRASAGKSAANWAPLGPTSWLTTSYNPGNGRVNVIMEDPADPNTIYAGTPAGGLWRSTDNGQSWSTLFSDLPTLGVSGIAIHPVNGTLFVATGDGNGTDTYSMGVIKSTDDGVTWISSGLDWQTAQVRTTNALRMHPTDPQVMFCATSHGLWKTSDGGVVWAKVAEGRFRDVEFKPTDPSIVYACTDQFFRSTDGGSTFTAVTTGLPVATDVNRMQIAVTAADPAMVYVVAGREDDAGFKGIYRSSTSGTSFNLRSSSPNLFGYYENGTDAGGQSWYDMALDVDPVNAQHVYVGGINVWKSTDGGTSWEIKSHWTYPSIWGYTHADIHHIGFHGNRLYVGSDGGIFRSVNGGTDWTDLSEGLEITQFYRLGGSADDASLIMAGAQDNGCNLFDGTLWTHVLGADGMETAITPGDPAVMYACQQYGSLYRSDDGGATFNIISFSIPEEGAWVTPYVIDPSDNNVLVAGYKNIWRSTDRGDSWTQISAFNTTRTVRALAVAPSNSATIYFANDLNMRRTTNTGSTWQVVGTTLPDQVITSIAVDPLDALHVYVSLSGYADGQKVLESLDGGATWTNRSGNLPNVPANTLVLAPGSDGLYVGTDLGVFHWDPLLSTWQPFSQGLPNCIITELEVHEGAGKLRASTFGRGLWESDLFVLSGAPPVASFTSSTTTICAGGTITFHDASLEAAPGWNWDFPGGTPATSTAAAPVVSYPAAGIYTANLTVSNVFGSDAYSAAIAVTVLPNPITVTVDLDDYPNETSWSITNDLTGIAVANGGPFQGHEDQTTETATFCLDQGCYTFTIADSYGDGICCDNGNGSYTVTNPVLGTIASGGSFGASEGTGFCVSLSVGAPSATPVPLLDLYPMDAEGLFALDLDGGASTGYLLSVRDALGREVLTRSVRAVALQREPLDLRGLSAGSYTVAVRSGPTQWTARLVKP
jgi:PKD repeat protein/photosystem II stability/assembly factor-like uncharacterized protein